MKETLLVYHLPGDIYAKIEDIAQKLQITLRTISDSQCYETIGYLLDIDGFSSAETSEHMVLDQPFVFFAGMNDQQLNSLLELFRYKDIPHIPYKAVLTDVNIHYRFVQLYQSVALEYEEIQKNKKSL